MIKIIKQSFNVKYTYNIIFTKDIFDIKNKTLINTLNFKTKIKKKIIIFLDKNIYKQNNQIYEKINAYIKHNNIYIELVCNPILITGGEKIKNHYSIVKYIYKLIDDYKICRQSYIISIGGGTFQDLLGFISSTAHRGIKLIRIPTTTLSQDDSGVGVKNGINFGKKNFIGCFNTPQAVINDINFLHTLKKDVFIEGFSEALKVALIKKKSLFELIKNNTTNILNKNEYVIEKIIFESAKIHAYHISKKGDPFENKSSRPLDFGHWSAHKLESLSKYKISHGKAVSIGIALDCTYSYLLKIIKKHEWKDIINTLQKLTLPIYANDLSMKDKNENYSIFKGLEEFREHLGGKLTITLIKKIGEKIEIHHTNKNIYKKAIFLLKKIYEKSNYENK